MTQLLAGGVRPLDRHWAGEFGMPSTSTAAAPNPFSFPLRPDWDEFALSRWGLTTGEIRALERHGAPIHANPAKTANGERPYIVVHEFDAWMARPESIRAAAGTMPCSVRRDSQSADRISEFRRQRGRWQRVLNVDINESD